MKITIGEAVNPRVDAYVKYLSELREWTLFINATFWKATSASAAKRILIEFLENLNTRNILLVDRYCLCYAFIEKHNTPGSGYHIHALVDRINPRYANRVQCKVRREFGIRSVVYSYETGLKTKRLEYLAKKIIKDTTLDNYTLFKVNCKHRKVLPTTLIGAGGWKE